MKRIAIILMIMLVAVSFAFAEGQKEQASSSGSSFEDGIYFAQEDGFSEKTGWKYMVTIEVEDGEIVEAEWNGAHKSAGTSKVTQSESGEYGMVEKGDAIAPWYEQAEKTEQYLLETQDPTKIEYSNDAGNTDAISGVTIHVKEYFTLAQKALQQGPDGYGMWEDGHYHAEAGEFSENGWKATVDLTVVSGYIVAANWNSIPEEGGKKKKQASMEGEYGMVANSNAELHWYEQAARAEQYLLETQDPTDISYTDDGATDAISGVSITVDEFFTLAQEALEGAKR